MNLVQGLSLKRRPLFFQILSTSHFSGFATYQCFEKKNNLTFEQLLNLKLKTANHAII